MIDMTKTKKGGKKTKSNLFSLILSPTSPTIAGFSGECFSDIKQVYRNLANEHGHFCAFPSTTDRAKILIWFIDISVFSSVHTQPCHHVVGVEGGD